VDLQPWMGQLGIASASVVLFVLIGRSYINSVANRVKEITDAHERELARLTVLWEARLSDVRERAEAWEAAASRREEATQELTAAVTRVETVGETAIHLLRALREGQAA
jgi:hypothetical protein